MTHFQENIGENPIQTVPDVTSFPLDNTSDVFEKKADELTAEEMKKTKEMAEAF